MDEKKRQVDVISKNTCTRQWMDLMLSCSSEIANKVHVFIAVFAVSFSKYFFGAKYGFSI